MKDRRKIAIGIVVAILGGLSFMVLRDYASSAEPKAVPFVDASGNTIQQVSLANDRATPNTVTVRVGQTVQFNADDGLKHDIGQGEGGEHHEEENDFESGEFGPGEAWRVTFNKPGTFQLHDHEHPNISVLVVAYQSEK